jgi:hypothetical protein
MFRQRQQFGLDLLIANQIALCFNEVAAAHVFNLCMASSVKARALTKKQHSRHEA